MILMDTLMTKDVRFVLIYCTGFFASCRNRLCWWHYQMPLSKGKEIQLRWYFLLGLDLVWLKRVPPYVLKASKPTNIQRLGQVSGGWWKAYKGYIFRFACSDDFLTESTFDNNLLYCGECRGAQNLRIPSYHGVLNLTTIISRIKKKGLLNIQYFRVCPS